MGVVALSLETGIPVSNATLTESRPSRCVLWQCGREFYGSEMAIIRPKKERNKDTREAHRAKIAELRLRGWSQPAIAEELGLSQQTVSNELKKLRAMWIEEQKTKTDALIAEQFLRLETLAHEAWRAWEASKEEQVTTVTEEGETPKGSINKKTTRKTKTPGNANYLNAALSAIAQINQVAGIPTWNKFQELNGAYDALTKEGYIVSLPEENRGDGTTQ